MFAQNSITPHNRETNKKLVKIIHALLQSDESVPFRKPVPHKALRLDDYKNIVKRPIDLNQIRRQNNQGRYKIIEEAFDDIQLCWDNCKIYNHPTSEIYQQALVLQKKFKAMIAENFPIVHQQIQNNQVFNNKEIPSYEPISQREKLSENLMEEQQSQNENYDVKENSYSKNQNWSRKKREKVSEFDPYQGENSKRKGFEMEAEDDMEESVMKDENRSQKSENREPIKEPIMVNLYERPTPENIQQMNRKMKLIQQNKQQLEEVLQILYTFERQNMVMDKNGEMSFKINQIHLSTYYRICKVLKIDPQQPLQIIQ